VIDVAQTRVYALLNLSVAGMIVDSIGELEDLRAVNNALTARVFAANRDVVLGIKLRLSRPMVGDNGPAALRLARELCDQLAAPLVIHPGDTTLSIAEILDSLGPGDVLTHAYHGRSEGCLDENGRVRREVRAAAERGVLFDVGHGRGSFAWGVAERAIAQGFVANTISSDLHAYCLHGPVFDLATTISKFVHLGLPLDDAIARATVHSARAMGIEDRVGSLKPGLVGDVAAFALEEGEFTFHDAADEVRIGKQRLVPRLSVRGGKIYRDARDQE